MCRRYPHEEPALTPFATDRLAFAAAALFTVTVSAAATSLVGCAGDAADSPTEVGVGEQELGRVHRPAREAHFVAVASDGGFGAGEMTDLFLHGTSEYTATVVETPDSAGACASPTCTHEETGRYMIIGNIRTNQLVLWPQQTVGALTRSYQMVVPAGSTSVLFVRGTSTTELVRM
jgi:hypothetical protein